MQTTHHHLHRALQIAAALLPLVAIADLAPADIYQWEYINPADPPQGKRQSTTLAPDGTGVDAVPGADLADRNLSIAYLIGADLTGVDGMHANLTNADLSHANLTNANLGASTLTDADFTNAEVRGASFAKLVVDIICPPFGCSPVVAGTGISPTQLYSTASYQAGDLSGVHFGHNNLAGGTFAAQNLANANFGIATLTGANFREANLTNAGFQSANLTGVNFRQANLTNADFEDYSCFETLCFPGYALVTDADFTAADTRGAYLLPAFLYPANAVTTNLILPDGHVTGLDLDAGGLLIVRDHDGNPRDTYGIPIPPISIPITVDQHLEIGPGGTLRMVFEADAWDSTISFAPGIPVALGGTLELTFADDVNLAAQVGRTFDLFDWTGVEPTGAFAISSPYAWNLSKLYTTGEVTLIAIPEPSVIFLSSIALAVILAWRRADPP